MLSATAKSKELALANLSDSIRWRYRLSKSIVFSENQCTSGCSSKHNVLSFELGGHHHVLVERNTTLALYRVSVRM